MISTETHNGVERKVLWDTITVYDVEGELLEAADVSYRKEYDMQWWRGRCVARREQQALGGRRWVCCPLWCDVPCEYETQKMARMEEAE